MKITVVILTFNEELHIARCIDSIQSIASKIVIVDCFSSDSTIEIAKNRGAEVIQHEWLNHSAQFNWALDQLDHATEWVLRIDADEILTPGLITEIIDRLPTVKDNIDGVYFPRRMVFQGKIILHGGVFPVMVLRLFRHGRGRCENRLMDEHIKVTGLTTIFNGEILDFNLNPLTWWIEKHNKYASYEAIELLNLEYSFMRTDSLMVVQEWSQAGIKRWIKEAVYAKLPRGLRAFIYFIYRYLIRFGFMDGQSGTTFHLLQGFWYRYLVDAKIIEVKTYMDNNKTSINEAIYKVLEVRV